MTFHDFSEKQLAAMLWWSGGSPYREREAVICDGAVRSGKTVCMGLGFFLWAMTRFSGERFALCGRSLQSLRRNVAEVLIPVLAEAGMTVSERVSAAELRVSWRGHSNRFSLFGGSDGRAAGAIQGLTLAGVLFDEAALLPREFVEQACARCSVAGSRFWFNCNPEGPQHWFYREWILRAEERRALYLHFRMEDNPGLDADVAARYRRMFSGVFFRRFILGEWVAAQGLVYDFFDGSFVAGAPPESEIGRWAVSCDYGTANPASFGLWGERGGVWYRVREYYFDSRREGRQKTDAEYAADLAELVGERKVFCVVVDPSAASFIELLRRDGWPVVKAKNDVLDGIRQTAAALKERRVCICSGCTDTLREMGLYCWAGDGTEQVRKENDHAMDDLRYFVSTVAERQGGDFAAAAIRR